MPIWNACENVYTDYFCEKSGSCWVKSNTKKLGCRYSSASACEEANVGYNCAWNGNTSDFDSSVKCYGTSTKKTFTISGIPFAPEFNVLRCENPADIDLNGNDLIALINLILEKERIDKDPNKQKKTAEKYISFMFQET